MCQDHELRGGPHHAGFCLRQQGTCPFFVVRFRALRAKTNNERKKSTALPQAIMRPLRDRVTCVKIWQGRALERLLRTPTSGLNRLNRRCRRLLQRRAPFQLLDLPERIAVTLQTPIVRDAIGG
jgi:hypothetical protein